MEVCPHDTSFRPTAYLLLLWNTFYAEVVLGWHKRKYFKPGTDFVLIDAVGLAKEWVCFPNLDRDPT